MNPVKIIHKCKNNNRRVQYLIYIFIGSIIDEEINNILESIKTKSLFNTFIFLSKHKIDKLVEVYGDYWYNYFFNKYHIIEQIKFINNTNTNKKLIEDKMGKNWFNEHMVNIIIKKIQYSYATSYYNYLVARNKIKSLIRKEDIDFRTHNLSHIMKGGDDMDGENIVENKEDDDDSDDMGEPNKTIEDFEDDVMDDFNIDELTKLYSMDIIENDKNIKETSKLISEAIKDTSYIKMANKSELLFDNTIEDISYDIKLEDVYNKHYVRDQYIFMDDSIKNIKNKIAVSIPISSKFGKDIKLLPEYQYFWSEYNTNDMTDYIMLGQKWIRKNEMVKIDIKPNDNISVYENLRNNLSYLKDSFGIKLKREDDEHFILRDYEDFISYNEIYMLDIINELGLNYKIESEKKRNIYEVYVNIYFPLISYERFENIIKLLNGTSEVEYDLNINNFNIIRNDIKMENEIYTLIEETKLKSNEYNKYFLENHIIQSIIHINLNNTMNKTGTISTEKYNLFKIFDNFIVNEDYPFVQYMTSDSQLTYKFYTKTKKIDDMEILSKWFENSAFGLSFKIKVKGLEHKYISINMNEMCRLEYKITWKEEDKATVDNIKASYIYVNELLLKINSENNKIKIILPQEHLFKYAFINTILKFTLPDKYKINHDDLSDFSRFFYTYISLVIEPKKRVSIIKKDTLFSKFGTYLRYKRISNYENKTKMHLRILYFLRNFDITNKELIDEIAKQFNITMEQASTELDNVKSKYGKILGKMKKILRKLKSMPKSKPPGIGIDIQGRSSDNYKIRITGARSKRQLEEILEFVKVLIYLYVQTYLVKNSKYQKIKDKLVKLTNIAKRRNKVNQYINYDIDVATVKQITNLDKKRLGFKPEEGQNQWTRSCQNSGDDKKRRPIIISNDNIKDLIKRGYKLNTKTNDYEKTSIITIKNKKKQITVKAIKLSGENDMVNYFACDPDENNDHAYIGFLSKSNNPNDLCMPCCFKKDHSTSVNKKKKNYYMKCVGQKVTDDMKDNTGLGDKLYILQDTNKLQDGRFIFLPKYLNYFFNILWKNECIIKNHYMIESKSGFFFKYTVKHNYYFFLNALSNIYDKTIEEIINNAINIIERDKDDIIFTYLNNGDIRSMFKDRENFINYLKNSNYIEYDIIGELLGIPGCITPKGITYFIFEKRINIIKKNLEKDKYIENYYIMKLNIENYSYMSTDRDIVILIKDGKYYFPIYYVKKSKTDKKIILNKIFNINDIYMKNIIADMIEYYKISCIDNFIYNINNNYNLTAKILNTMNINIKRQIIDDRNKVKYLILENGLIIPTTLSGTILDIPISYMKQSYLLDLNTTIKYLNLFNKKILSLDNTIKSLDYIPKTLQYNMTKNSMYNVTSIYLMNGMTIPIINIMMTSVQFKKYGLGYEFQPIEEMINIEISKNEKLKNDTRIINVRNRVYRNEALNLFRLELSMYLANNHKIKDTIIGIVRNKNITKTNKMKELLKIILGIIKEKSPKNKLLQVINKLPNLIDYKISNIREYCKNNREKGKCNENLHCTFVNNTCIFTMYKNDIMNKINNIIEEMIIDGTKFKELIQEDIYYVSDIVDYMQYSDRPNQKIIKTSNFNIKKIMTELFGKDSVPNIGKHKKIKSDNINIEENYPEVNEIGNQIIQEIISNKNSIIRAYVNSYYWLHNNMYEKESRNLKYFSEMQDMLTNLFKANIIDYIMNNIYNDLRSNDIMKDIIKYFNMMNTKKSNLFTSALNRFRKNNYNTDGILELTILSYMFSYPIIVYDNFNIVKYIFSNGMVKVNSSTIEKYTSKNDYNKTIYLKFEYDGINKIPSKIYSIYYD